MRWPALALLSLPSPHPPWADPDGYPAGLF